MGSQAAIGCRSPAIQVFRSIRDTPKPPRSSRRNPRRIAGGSIPKPGKLDVDRDDPLVSGYGVGQDCRGAAGHDGSVGRRRISIKASAAPMHYCGKKLVKITLPCQLAVNNFRSGAVEF